jgi:hypothetical protein
MDSGLREYLSYSVGIAAVIGLIRLGKLPKSYRPFIIILVLGFANELLSQSLIKRGYYNHVNTNVYSILESLLLLWLFRNWNLFPGNRNRYWIMGILFILLWSIDWLFISPFFVSYFNIVYSFLVVLMSIHMINQIVFIHKAALLRNAQFLISLGFVIYFTFKVLIEIFWVYGFRASSEFTNSIYDIMAYINFAVNLLFAYAIIWIPRKQEYTLQ